MSEKLQLFEKAHTFIEHIFPEEHKWFKEKIERGVNKAKDIEHCFKQCCVNLKR
ncbi:hypothetical protein GCM10011369_18580 [Neiella marina]|uniref:Uncharacterized protein n=1 Tax=Neiella marina TaxID=508461 RepID=A0A8J2U509_9GAMM|nr:hypothetical protein [Neiella marina]GGA76958.1 hypothetical protein GCM10011369_18580 [Neiella marina]